MQAIPMRWEFAESVVTSDSSGGVMTVDPTDVAGMLEAIGAKLGNRTTPSRRRVRIQYSIRELQHLVHGSSLLRRRSHADLSDFFFVWLKRALLNSPLAA